MNIPPSSSILPSVLGLQPYEWLTLIGIVIGPIVAVLITLWREDYRRQQEARTQIVRMLINARGMPSDPTYSSAINLVPVEFNSEPTVITAWSAYVGLARTATTPEGQYRHDEMLKAKQTTLIYSILKVLKIDISETDINTQSYYSDGFLGRDNLYLDSLKSMREIADSIKRSADFVEQMAILNQAGPTSSEQEKSEKS